MCSIANSTFAVDENHTRLLLYTLVEHPNPVSQILANREKVRGFFNHNTAPTYFIHQNPQCLIGGLHVVEFGQT